MEGSGNKAVLPTLTSPLFFQGEFGPVEGRYNKAVLPSLTSPLFFQWEFGLWKAVTTELYCSVVTSPYCWWNVGKIRLGQHFFAQLAH